jgi:hypothetical protein
MTNLRNGLPLVSILALAFCVGCTQHAPDDGVAETAPSAGPSVATLSLIAGARSTQSSNVDGVALDGLGTLYFADATNIRSVVLATGVVRTLASVPSGVARLAYDGAGALYVTGATLVSKIDLANNAISVVAGSMTAGTDDGTGPAATFTRTDGIYLHPSGTLYVMDDSSIRSIEPATGVVKTIAGIPGAYGAADGVGSNARFSRAAGITGDGGDTLFVADTANQAIRSVSISAGIVTTVAGELGTNGFADGDARTEALFSQPSAVAFDDLGELYISDADNASLRKLAVGTRQVTTVFGSPGSSAIALGPLATAQLHKPLSVLVDTAKRLYLADDNAVLRVDLP